MPVNPNSFAFSGITFVHREPAGTQALMRVPRLYWPSDETILDLDVTARRTLEAMRTSGDKRVYTLGMYHAALLNTLLTLGDSENDRELWQPIQTINNFMGNPDNRLTSLNPTALMRTIRALDTLASDIRPGTKFIEQKMRTKNTSAYRIYPGIGLCDSRD